MLRGLSRQDWSSTSPSYPKNLIPKKIITLYRPYIGYIGSYTGYFGSDPM